eukprot:XP_011679853.1 PREDICTED: GSK-3-binding protein-like [Strongylocentrotus purpuratus]
MPSVSGSTSESTVQSRESNFGTGEMEDLMRRITDSLRLKASCKQKVHAQRSLQRTTPYTLPTPKKYLKCQEQCKYHRSRRQSCENSCSDNPHELLKNLLRDKSLIAEAVKRLQSKLDEALPLLTNRISASDSDFACS